MRLAFMTLFAQTALASHGTCGPPPHALVHYTARRHSGVPKPTTHGSCAQLSSQKLPEPHATPALLGSPRIYGTSQQRLQATPKCTLAYHGSLTSTFENGQDLGAVPLQLGRPALIELRTGPRSPRSRRPASRPAQRLSTSDSKSTHQVRSPEFGMERQLAF